jgi:hypothetical protein
MDARARTTASCSPVTIDLVDADLTCQNLPTETLSRWRHLRN